MATHHTPGGAVLDIQLASGLIEIETADTDTTVVDLEPLTAGDDAALEVIAATRELERTEDGGARVVVHVPKRRSRLLGLGSEPEVLVRIAAPRGSRAELQTIAADVRVGDGLAALRAKTISGDIKAAAVADAVVLHTTSGDVSVSSAGGATEVHSISGDVRVGTAGGDAALKSMSGDVKVAAAAASMAVSTMSGDIEVGRAQAGEVDLRSMSGDLAIGVQRGTRVYLEVRTLSGDAQSELAVSDSPAEGDGPELTLRADTKSGDIRIRRAPEPAEVG